MPDYYARDGSPMDMLEWVEAFEDGEGRRIGSTELEDGRWVSTVWLGLDHSFGTGPPLIFETMVFRSRDRHLYETYCERYATEEDAKDGHARIVAECEQGEHV